MRVLLSWRYYITVRFLFYNIHKSIAIYYVICYYVIVMKKTQKEINEEFNAQPDYQVGEFLIYRDGMIDKFWYYQLRARRFARRAQWFGVCMGKVFVYIGTNWIKGILEDNERKRAMI